MIFKEFFFFVVGFFIGSAVILIPFTFHTKQQARRNVAIHQKFANRIEIHEAETRERFDETVSEALYDDIKVLCMVMTMPANHKTKAVHIKNTWGKRCNKLLFMTSQEDPNLETVVLPFKESRKILWEKTKAGFKHLHETHLNEFDWFLKADDDNFIIIENLRYLLAHYNPKTALYLGHRFAQEQVDEGYMAGGGYILSKKALKKFVETIVNDPKKCHPHGGAEDLEMGRCLAHSAIAVDCTDELHQKRFFPVGVEEHMQRIIDPNYWYTQAQYYHVTQGNTSCCSDTSAEFHYISPHEMYMLDYLIYTVHPFGVSDDFNDKRPKVFPLQEVIDASDVHSSSPNFHSHQINHQLDPDEYY